MKGTHTIEMPKALLRKWLKALRSGKIKQGVGQLLDTKSGAMCCLGVLEWCVRGTRKDIERDESSYEDENGKVTKEITIASLPSREWLREHGVRFMNIHGIWGMTSPGLPVDNAALGLGMPLRDAANLNDACDMNGKHQFNFKIIADAIERTAKAT